MLGFGIVFQFVRHGKRGRPIFDGFVTVTNDFGARFAIEVHEGASKLTFGPFNLPAFDGHLDPACDYAFVQLQRNL